MSASSVCFIANFHKTAFFHAWAAASKLPVDRICWITTNRKLFDWLKQRYPAPQILLLNWPLGDTPRPPLGDFRLRELVFGDRCLRYQMEPGLRWLTAIQEPVAEFLRDRKVRHLLGEVTWAHEILIHRMTRALPDLACTFLNPHTVRIPNGRFGLFLDEQQTELLPSGEALPDPADLKAAFAVKKPDYLALNDRHVQASRRPMARLAKIKRFFSRENIDPLDPTLLDDRWIQLRLRGAEEWSREAYPLLRREPLEALAGAPYAFLGLHKQPEASIDVLGRYHEDQFTNIQNVWRSLPAGWRLAVKEHTNAIGDRPLAFYRALKRLPGVVLVDERIDSHALISGATQVVTVSGTLAYEAALLGKESVTLAPTFFNRLEGCRNLDLGDLQRPGAWEERETRKMDLESFRIWLWRHSFPGIISDPVSNPRCIEGNNIELLGSHLLKILDHEQ